METAKERYPSELRLQPHPPYWSLFIMSFQQSVAYRMRTFLSLLVNLVWVMMLYYLWKTVYSGTDSIQGFQWPEMRTYIILSFAINVLLTFSNANRITSSIRTGEIVQDLTKPIDYLSMQLALACGASVTEGGLSAVLTIGLGVMVSGILPPESILSVFLFVISILLGFLIKFLINFLTSLISFWTVNSLGIYWAQTAIVNLFSGMLVPLVFFPEWLQRITACLPFQGIIYTPVMIFLGKLNGIDLAIAVGEQFFWVLMLWFVSRLLWKKAFRALEIQGG